MDCDDSENACGEKFEPNSIKSRISILSYEANNPMEDKYAQLQFKENQLGYMAAVFDGHGGFEVSQLVSETLHLYLEESFSPN